MSTFVILLKRGFLLMALASFVSLSSCANESSEEDSWSPPFEAPVPPFASAVFSTPTTINNTYFPLVPGTTTVSRTPTEDGLETGVFEVTTTTRVIVGVTCVQVRDRVYLDDLLIEDTVEWFAQDDAGNVWYFGEDVTNYEYDDNDTLVGTNSDGSWEAGADIAGTGTNATAGILMEAAPVVGDAYHQEFYPGEAEDRARVEALNVSITLADGRVFSCLQTLEFNPLEEDSEETKYYAPGAGLIREAGGDIGEMKAIFKTGAINVPNFGAATFSNSLNITNPFFTLVAGTSYTYRADTGDEIETIIVDVLTQTKVILGVTCRVVHDRVYVDGRLVEDTYDWYAQDDAGNVWYMGEDVTDYFYDAMGALTGTSNAGSFEAGVGGALAGFAMPATPATGLAFEQEYFVGEAEDVAMVLATNLTVTLSNGTIYTGCIQTIDWNPLNPSVLESKFYAPGVGPNVKEIELGGVEVIELTLITP